MASSDVAIDLTSSNNGRQSPGVEQAYLPTAAYRYSSASYSDNDLHHTYGDESPPAGSEETGVFVEPNPSLLWTKENVEADDYLHVSLGRRVLTPRPPRR